MLPHQGHRAGGPGNLIRVERENDGTLRLHGEPLREHGRTLLELLDDAARRAPDRAFLIERDAREVWHQVSFATVAERSRRIGAALRDLGASAERPVMILSGNGIDHAMVTFGALRAGIPVVPVDAATGLAVHDGFARLRAIADAVRPGVVFARDGTAYAAGVRAAAADAAYVCATEAPRGMRAHDYARLLTHPPLVWDAVAPNAAATDASAVAANAGPRAVGAIASRAGSPNAGIVNADAVAKVLFPAGPTGELKGVVVTHGMICAMLQGIAQAWPFMDDHPPVVVDRLPWSHGFGGNIVLGIVLRNAGTLYVDHGDRTPDSVERSARLRAEIPPTLAFDVPRGWSAWVRRLRGDDALRRRWLSKLDCACWSGTTLAPETRDALRAIDVPLAAAWGSTETSAAATLTTGIDPPYDALGVPLAGVELKLVPSAAGYDARVRGPQVTTGYWWRPELTAAAFDEEGFYRTGDLVRPIHARAPQRGIAFGSRLDARFKLSSGTWVRGGALREAFLAECSDVADAVVTGEGRDEVGLLVWPTADGVLLDRDVLRAQIADAMRRVNAAGSSAGGPSRALIVAAPLPAAERAAAVGRIHASEPDAEVIVL